MAETEQVRVWDEKRGAYVWATVQPSANGLTLRDYFAGQALAGLTAAGKHFTENTSELAYKLADAMLKARG